MGDKISLEISAKRLPNKDPKIMIIVGNSKRELTLSQDRIKIDVELSLGYNEISIVLLNKHPRDTKVRDSIIVEDLAVIIEHMRYRSIDFIDRISDISEYTRHDGSEIKGTNGYMAFAGTLKIKLKSPLFIFDRELSITHGQ